MNKFTSLMTRCATIAILCCVVLAFSAFTLPTKAKTMGSASPLTTMNMTASPASQTVYANSQANITFTWHNGGLGRTVFIVDWRDGHSESYVCGFNCVDGAFTYGHSYASRGTFIAKGYLDSDSSVAAWSTVKVI
jgi:hypothetical protein